MNPEDLNLLKEFLAAEWGLAPGEVGEQEAKSRYSRRWRKFFIGLFLVATAYLILRVFVGSLAARAFVAGVILTSLILCLRALRFAGCLTAGPLLIIKKQVAEKLHRTIEEIDDEAVNEYDRRNQRSIVRGLIVVALVAFLADWIWPSAPLEVLALFIFYAVGVQAWVRHRGRVAQAARG